MMKSTIALTMAALFTSTSVFAQQLQWNYNGQAIAKGQTTPAGLRGASGCDSDAQDIFFVTAGNEISIVFTKMFVELNDPALPMSGRKNCHIIIPTKIAAGLYVGRLDQKLTWAIQKTKGSSARVGSRARFFDQGLGSISIVRGPTDEGLFEGVTAATPTDFRVFKPTWCAHQAGFTGNFIVDIFADALRRKKDQVVSVFRDGYDARWTAVASLFKCNSK